MSAIENISPSVIKRISKELNTLVTQPPEGIRVIVNELDVCDVQAWILGPESTPYEGGCFRVKLVLGADFPSAPPKCYFITKIFHPNVSKSGEVCVNTLKKDWNKDSGVERILLTVKCLLIVPNPESALNEEAGKLLLENYEDYAKHARMMTKVHAQNKSVEFSSIFNNSSTTTTSTSTTNITSATTTTTTTTSTSTTSSSSPKKFVSSLKTTPPQNTTTSTMAATTMTNNSNMTNSPSITALITPLTVSNSMNESKSQNAMSGNNNHNHLKKNSMNSNDNQLASNNPTVTPKKRSGDKKLDKKQVDKKRSLKRL